MYPDVIFHPVIHLLEIQVQSIHNLRRQKREHLKKFLSHNCIRQAGPSHGGEMSHLRVSFAID